MTRSEVSWERIIHLANNHLMIAALWVGLYEKELDSELENGVRDYLQELHTLNLRRNQSLKRQVIEAIEVLNKKGIVPMLIKGAVQLFQPVHRDFGARIMTDLDILVPKNRIVGAIKALNQIEYQIQNVPNVNWNIHRHAEPMVRPGEYGSIELHRSALGKYADHILTTADIWAKAEYCVTNGVRFKVPNTTHSILLVILHSQIGHGYHQRLMLDYKGLHDMIVMTGHQKRRVEWDQIRNRLANLGLSRVLRAHMWIAHRLFNLPLQSDIGPTAYTRIYHGLFMSRIRWAIVDEWFEIFFDSFIVCLRKRFGPLKQLLPLRLVFRKNN